MPGPSPAAWLSPTKVSPSCLCRSVVALLLVFVQLNLSYPNLLLEKPLRYLKRVLRVTHYAGEERGYINIWLPLVFCLRCCISVADVFLFWAETLFPASCGPRSLAVCAVTPGNVRHLGTNTMDGGSLRTSPRLRRPPGCGRHPGGCGSPAHSPTCCQPEPLTPAGLCLLAARRLMKLPWTSSWFTACEIFRLVHHWVYFVSVGFADINSNRMRSALNSSENPSSKEFVFPQ